MLKGSSEWTWTMPKTIRADFKENFKAEFIKVYFQRDIKYEN
jgi:hypothetical protein